MVAPSASPRPTASVAHSTALRVELLEDWGAVAALEHEWNALLHESSADSIFLTWQWVKCWAEVVGASVRPLVVCVRDASGALVGLAPFYETTIRLGFTVPYRVLRVMGDVPTGADYPDWIIRRDGDTATGAAIVDGLSSRSNWDCIWMMNMAGWTGSVERIVAACRNRGLRCEARPRDFSWFELPSDMTSYMRALSRNKRQQLRAETKRILGRPTVEICRCENQDQLAEFLEALFGLHNLRWQDKGEAGAFRAQPQEAEFYGRFTRVALQEGWLRFFGLRDEGTLKAVQIGYVYRNVFHQLQEGFDPDYLHGAGNVLRARVIEACIEEGVEAYDFLGEMSEHKRRWLGQARAGCDLLIGRPTLKSLPLFHGVWPSCRLMRQDGPLG